MMNHASESAKPSIRVVVADDHNRVRTGIAILLAGVTDIQVVGEAVDGAQALELAETLRPDILLLDVEMPILNGLEVAARLHESSLGYKSWP
jgi:YesN/AraC family two-component response regulator